MSHVVERSGRLKRATRISGAALRQRLISVLLVIIATSALLVAGAFEPVENQLTELRAQWLDRAPTGQVAIVEIDARSLAELSNWPWSRRHHADVVNRLHSAGAEIIAFDVDFSSLSEPSGDRAFAEAVRRAEPVILPIFQQRSSDQSPENIVIKSRPAPIFDKAWVGGVNIFPGADGVVREYPAATIIGGEIRPSISTLLAESDDLGDRSFQPDWAIDAQRIPRFSFVDVVKGRVPREAIVGKRILIGATAIELGDRYVVPRLGSVPGVVVQALAARVPSSGPGAHTIRRTAHAGGSDRGCTAPRSWSIQSVHTYICSDCLINHHPPGGRPHRCSGALAVVDQLRRTIVLGVCLRRAAHRGGNPLSRRPWGLLRR